MMMIKISFSPMTVVSDMNDNVMYLQEQYLRYYEAFVFTSDVLQAAIKVREGYDAIIYQDSFFTIGQDIKFQTTSTGADFWFPIPEIDENESDDNLMRIACNLSMTISMEMKKFAIDPYSTPETYKLVQHVE